MNDLSMTQAASLAAFVGAPLVRDFPVIIKRITTTDDGKLQIVLEAQSIGDEELAKVQRMLELQRDGAMLTLEPVQRNLFGEVPGEVPKAEETSRKS